MPKWTIPKNAVAPVPGKPKSETPQHVIKAIKQLNLPLDEDLPNG